MANGDHHVDLFGRWRCLRGPGRGCTSFFVVVSADLSTIKCGACKADAEDAREAAMDVIRRPAVGFKMLEGK